MDTIRILPGNRHVTIKVNGRDLIAIVAEIEHPFALKEGDPKLPGNYKGLPPKVVFAPSRHFLGEPNPDYIHNEETDGGKIAVLECGHCGYTECSCLLVKITVQDKVVIWSEFEEPDWTPKFTNKPWNYGGLKYVFDRGHYEAELARRPRDQSEM